MSESETYNKLVTLVGASVKTAITAEMKPQNAQLTEIVVLLNNLTEQFKAITKLLAANKDKRATKAKATVEPVVNAGGLPVLPKPGEGAPVAPAVNGLAPPATGGGLPAAKTTNIRVFFLNQYKTSADFQTKYRNQAILNSLLADPTFNAKAAPAKLSAEATAMFEFHKTQPQMIASIKTEHEACKTILAANAAVMPAQLNPEIGSPKAPKA